MVQLQNRLRILIVDDSISIRSVLRALLNNDDYEVVGRTWQWCKTSRHHRQAKSAYHLS